MTGSGSMERHPLGYLDAGGAFGKAVTPLLWYSLIVSLVVCLIVTVLVVWGVVARRVGNDRTDLNVTELTRAPGVRWIWIGIAISTVPLLVSLVWTVTALASVGTVPAATRLTIDVTAHQWWWDAVYSGSAMPAGRFHTANEIHVPVGQPVLLRLASTDVIHSFWVPQLAGKTDVIPGQVNQMWIRADRPGRYRGQCAEFCGYQHAHMAFQVIADPPAAFEAWRQAQLRDAPPPATPEQQHGAFIVQYRCAVCHAVRGTIAGSHAAPDLTHLMSRQTIAAGTLPNNRGSLAGWIEDPQSVKPGALMPPQALSGPELNELTAYLETLR